jgi:hypothetical protein
MRKLLTWLRRLMPPPIEPVEPARSARRPATAGERRCLNEAAHKRAR